MFVNVSFLKEMIQLTSSLKRFKWGSRDQKHGIRGICSVRGCGEEHVARTWRQALGVEGALTSV